MDILSQFEMIMMTLMMRTSSMRMMRKRYFPVASLCPRIDLSIRKSHKAALHLKLKVGG